ncbi:MAG: transketolase [Holosporaceae bacterium]|jgi:transketolase|nr:transketolase [Holosporaceae bacterium]
MFKALANAVRFLSIYQVANAGSGHLGMPLGMADCLTALFKNFLVFDPENPRWPNRDRFVLSGGHGSALLYSLLHLVGYKGFSRGDLRNFRKLGSSATGHPEYNLDCGLEATTGALGQGIANGVGMAVEERILNARFGDGCINHYTYVCAGDGDLMEGIAHEACAIAGYLSLGRLVVLFDDNGVTADGFVTASGGEDVLKRHEAYGWHAVAIDGHCEESLTKAINEAKNDERPSIIACKTHIGLGTSRENNSAAHSGPLSDAEILQARKFFDWPHAPFEIPEYIEKTWRVIGKRWHENCVNWFNQQSKIYGPMEFQVTPEIRKALRSLKKSYFVSRPFAATRKSSKEVISRIMESSDLVISGAADLGESTGCLAKDMKPIVKGDFSGNYIRYGVREHAMGAILNGVAVGGKIRCFGGTFLSFSDYMRPAIRMSAMMNIPTIFVFSHDSIGVGEDGPTHHPVEQLPALRAIPNLNVFRPADAMETLECWEYALKSQRPSVLVLSRQDLLSVRFSGRVNLCENGGYLLHEDRFSCQRAVTLIATGSEVKIALEVKKLLNLADICANVVSIPCWNLFEEQPDGYREHVLGEHLRIGIEASNGFGWEKYLGSGGMFFGVDGFGKSGSCAELYGYFELTANKICGKILQRLEQHIDETREK